MNPGNPDVRRQSKEVRLRIHTRTGFSLSHTHIHTCTGVCVVGCNSMYERDRKTGTDTNRKKGIEGERKIRTERERDKDRE